MIVMQLAIGLGAIAASVAVQALFMVALFGYLRRRSARPRTPLHKSAAISGVVIWLFLAICVICWGWSLLLVALGGFETTEEALYFSTVAFTTVGFGDVVLGQDLRLLGGFMAANGMIIFGWTTALVFVAVQDIYRDDLDL